jgi:hypothetical protein
LVEECHSLASEIQPELGNRNGVDVMKVLEAEGEEVEEGEAEVSPSARTVATMAISLLSC